MKWNIGISLSGILTFERDEEIPMGWLRAFSQRHVEAVPRAIDNEAGKLIDSLWDNDLRAHSSEAATVSMTEVWLDSSFLTSDSPERRIIRPRCGIR
jgi:hypothetical protein